MVYAVLTMLQRLVYYGWCRNSAALCKLLGALGIRLVADLNANAIAQLMLLLT